MQQAPISRTSLLPNQTAPCAALDASVAYHGIHARPRKKRLARSLTFIYVKCDRQWRNRGEECHVRHVALQCTLATANRASVELRDFTDNLALQI